MESTSEYGKRLVEARENLGITLAEVSYELKINLSTLKKLEDSDSKSLPKPPFTKGFIKAYCKLLKISPALILDEYEQSLGMPKDDTSKSVLVETSEPTDFFILDFLKDKFFPAILFISVIGAVFILYSFLGNYEESHIAEVEQPTTDKMIDVTPDLKTVKEDEISFDVFDESTPNEKVEDPKKVEPKNSESPSVEGTVEESSEVTSEVGEKPKYVPPRGKHRLVVEPLSKTYLYIKTNFDNSPVKATLIPDRVRTFRFDQAEIRFVDAGAVNVILDGDELGALGVFGEEKKLEFPSLKEL